MKASRSGLLAVACAVALWSSSVAAGAYAPQEFDWSGTIGSGLRLDVGGVNGAIVVVAGPGRELKVHALKSGRRHDPAKVKIDVSSTPKGVHVCTVYPGGRGCENGRPSLVAHDNDVNVDYRIVVPSGVQLELSTVNGNVEVENVDGVVHASTVNGNCDIATSASGQATTVNGSVEARVGRLGASDRLEFTTVNGSVTLSLPGDASVGVDATTMNGSIQTDFPLELRQGFGPRTLRGTLGRGGARVKLSSVNGSIRLRRDDTRSL